VSRGTSLTTTSYAVLGLLAVRPWSSYELTRQMDRSLGRFWPRAQSKLYEEPKKLVALGLARDAVEHTGKRERTVYTITEDGRDALRHWLGTPGAGPVLEFEQLLQVSFAENAGTDSVRATLAAARAWAAERNTENLAAAREHLDGAAAFPGRAAQNLLVGAFLTDFYALVASWAEWADRQVQAWPDDPAEAEADPAELAAVVRRATWD
jgi:PadR family transcriptional regulator, regulatory protein AphA